MNKYTRDDITAVIDAMYYDDSRDAKLGGPDYQANLQVNVEWILDDLRRARQAASAVNTWDQVNTRTGHGRVRPWEHVEREPMMTMWL